MHDCPRIISSATCIAKHYKDATAPHHHGMLCPRTSSSGVMQQYQGKHIHHGLNRPQELQSSMQQSITS